MKGLVFTTFFDFCGEQFGADLLDDAIDAASLSNGGAYTSVGTYPFEEMVALITQVVRLSAQPMPVLLEAFGRYCFKAWVQKFPASFEGQDLFDVLANIDHFHGMQVKTLYPDAELPSFTPVERSADHIALEYRSCKPLADLAVGVIRGAAAYLEAPVSVTYRAGTDAVRFEVRRQSSVLTA